MGVKEEGIEKMRKSLRTYFASRPFEQVGIKEKKKRVIEEQEGHCLWCGLLSWQGQLIVLEVDHIDGNRANGTRENLRALCPNCHSQTSTFRFKGRKHTQETKEKMAQRGLWLNERVVVLYTAGVGLTSTRPTKIQI